MAQRRIRPLTLSENAYGTAYPAPKVRSVDTTNLSGGLNLWDLDYRMAVNQSPDLLNVYWKDGSLSSRPGQDYVYNPYATDPDTQQLLTNYGSFYACYNKPWGDSERIIAHKGTKLYQINSETGAHTELTGGVTVTAASGGSFFVFGDSLYYMNGYEYVKITQGYQASLVEGYIPTTVMNRTPEGTGGNVYQPENRIAAGKRVQFTQNTTPATAFYLPYTGLDNKVLSIKANGHSEYYEYNTVTTLPTENLTIDAYYHTTSDNKNYKAITATTAEEVSELPASADYQFSVNRETGVVTFHTAPTQSTVPVANNVEITCYKSDAATYNSIIKCTCVTVYGADNNLAIVCGGPPAQPNAYFWTGNTSAGIDPSYFPFDSYNLAGNADEYITGFGKQQSMLVIFKEHSIGKASFDTYTDTTLGRDYLQLPFKPINDDIGAIEGSIQLVQNNLVFANTQGGVYVLLDTSAWGENTVKRISRNVNGDGTKGLLYDLRTPAATAITSYNDAQRYWLVANGKAYLWDFSLSGYSSYENKLSWFLFDNIQARGWFRQSDGVGLYFNPDGALIEFTESVFNDFGVAISRKYTFATQNFGTYEVLKDVLKVVFAVRSDTDTTMNITYKTDYEQRDDLTPIMAYSWRLYPRDLTHRSLRVVPFAYVHVRKPMCWHVRHFSMTLTNSTINTDMSLISAQIFYRFGREDR